MHRTRRLAWTAAAVLMAGGALAASHAMAQTPAQQEQANNAALGAVPGSVVESEQDTEGRRSVYEVEIRRASDSRIVEVTVDAVSAAVLGTEADDDDDDDDDDNGQATPQTQQGQEQARNAGLATVPGTVVGAEQEIEGGRAVYEVEVRRASDGRIVEVTVDSSSGAVLGTDLDDDDGPDDD